MGIQRLTLVIVTAVAISASCSSNSDNGTVSTTPGTADPLAHCEGSQVDLNSCATDALSDAEEALASLIEDARPHAGPRLEALRSSQEVWLSYRDGFCEAHGDEDGSIQRLNVTACKLDLTLDRSEDVCTWLAPNLEPGAEELPETCQRFAT